MGEPKENHELWLQVKEGGCLRWTWKKKRYALVKAQWKGYALDETRKNGICPKRNSKRGYPLKETLRNEVCLK